MTANDMMLCFLLGSGYFEGTKAIYTLNETFSMAGVRPLTLKAVLEQLGDSAGNLAFMRDVAAALELQNKRLPKVAQIMCTELAIFLSDILKGHDDDIETFWGALKDAPAPILELAKPRQEL
jgi:hypothetical protein